MTVGEKCTGRTEGDVLTLLDICDYYLVFDTFCICAAIIRTFLLLYRGISPYYAQCKITHKRKKSVNRWQDNATTISWRLPPHSPAFAVWSWQRPDGTAQVLRHLQFFCYSALFDFTRENDFMQFSLFHSVAFLVNIKTANASSVWAIRKLKCASFVYDAIFGGKSFSVQIWGSEAHLCVIRKYAK